MLSALQAPYRAAQKEAHAACDRMCGMRHATQRVACESIEPHHVGALVRRPPPRGPEAWGRRLGVPELGAAPARLQGRRLLICMEYVSMSIQQSPDRAAHKGRHAYDSIELHQFGALVRRPSPRGAEGLETWAWRAGAWLGDLGAAYLTRPGFGEHGVSAA